MILGLRLGIRFISYDSSSDDIDISIAKNQFHAEVTYCRTS